MFSKTQTTCVGLGFFWGMKQNEGKRWFFDTPLEEDLLIWLNLKHWIRSNIDQNWNQLIICSVGRIIWPRYLIDALDFCMFFQAQDIGWTDRL